MGTDAKDTWQLPDLYQPGKHPLTSALSVLFVFFEHGDRWWWRSPCLWWYWGAASVSVIVLVLLYIPHIFQLIVGSGIRAASLFWSQYGNEWWYSCPSSWKTRNFGFYLSSCQVGTDQLTLLLTSLHLALAQSGNSVRYVSCFSDIKPQANDGHFLQ